MSERRLRILFVSAVTPRLRGSGSEQRAGVAVEALGALGDVHWLQAPPDAGAFEAAGEDAPSPLLGAARTLSARALVRQASAPWRGFVAPGRWRRLLSDCWVTAGRVATPTAGERAALTAALRQQFGAEPFDLVYAFQAQAGALIEPVLAAWRSPGGRFVVDWDAAERPGVAEQSRMLPGGDAPGAAVRRWINDLKLGRIERRLLRAADVTLCASALDVAYFKQQRPAAQVLAIPNCVDVPEPPLSPRQPPGCALLFVGLINYWPNRQGLLHFVADIWPAVRARYPQATFEIVGRGVTPDIAALDGKDGIRVTGSVDDLRACYERCDIAVAPMRFSVGSSIKVLEGLAYGRPVVAYEAATRRHLLEARTEVGSARDAEAFREWIIGLLSDPARGHALAQAGRSRVLRQYNRARIIDALTATLRNALRG